MSSCFRCFWSCFGFTSIVFFRRWQISMRGSDGKVVVVVVVVVVVTVVVVTVVVGTVVVDVVVVVVVAIVVVVVPGIVVVVVVVVPGTVVVVVVVVPGIVVDEGPAKAGREVARLTTSPSSAARPVHNLPKTLVIRARFMSDLPP